MSGIPATLHDIFMLINFQTASDLYIRQKY